MGTLGELQNLERIPTCQLIQGTLLSHIMGETGLDSSVSAVEWIYRFGEIQLFEWGTSNSL